LRDFWRRKKADCRSPFPVLFRDGSKVADHFRAPQVDFMFPIPRLYPILDPGCFADSATMFAAAEELVAAGCTLLQYRNKSGNARRMLEEARELRTRMGPGITLIMNDRADLCLAAGFDGLHVGQDDLSPESARRVIGPAVTLPLAAFDFDIDRTRSRPTPRSRAADRSVRPTLGVSTHNTEQLAEADKSSADYLAIGPVFATASKANPDPVVGLEGVRRARALTRKPLVAIGGITRVNARSVIDAGADAVAVISDLLRDPGKSAEEFLLILG
jgi:thiamine-phosphate pyrophosphorylase